MQGELGSPESVTADPLWKGSGGKAREGAQLNPRERVETPNREKSRVKEQPGYLALHFLVNEAGRPLELGTRNVVLSLTPAKA